MANQKDLAWKQFIFPGSVLIGQGLGELFLRPLYKRNLVTGMEPVCMIGYIVGDLFLIFITYYLVTIVVSEF